MLQEINAFTLVIIGSGIISFIVAIFLIIYYRYANRMIGTINKTNQLKIEHQKELLKNEIEAIDKERERLARDLHDEVGALLSYISMNMSKQNVKDTKEILLKNIAGNKSKLDKGIEKIRSISHSLLPPTLDLFGLEVALDEFFGSLDSSFKISINSNFDLNTIQKDKTLHLYRLIMEFVNNSIKHSKGNSIKIDFKETENKIQITLSDNGKGFVYKDAILKSGIGLKNIETRLSALNAEYKINTQKGTSINISLQKDLK